MIIRICCITITKAKVTLTISAKKNTMVIIVTIIVTVIVITIVILFTMQTMYKDQGIILKKDT